MPRMCTLLLGAFALFATVHAAAQATPSVEVALQPASTTVRLDGAFVFHALIRNTERARTVVLRGMPGFNPGGGLELVVVDPAGQRRTVAHPAGARSVEEATRDGRARPLRPGEALAVRHRERASGLFPAPGKYEVRVRYTSPSRGAQPMISGAVEGASAESEPVIIEVLR
ncbi:MAG: hypothetical protein KatS3mg127_0580 [Silanimonas sp.]|nr:MAG: hypothetical protein KatS3mg127_0580 [Silanimonas sp.]